MPAKLSVNLNAVALLRNRRDLPWPSVTEIGRLRSPPAPMALPSIPVRTSATPAMPTCRHSGR